MNDQALEKLKAVIKLLNEGLSRAEFVQSIEAITKVVVKSQSKLLQDSQEMMRMCEKMKQDMAGKQEMSMADMKRMALDYCSKEMSKMQKEHSAKMRECEQEMSEMKDEMDAMTLTLKEGIDFGHEKMLEEMKGMIPEVKEETPEGIRDKLSSLEGEDRLDKASIKGLEEYIKNLIGAGSSITYVGGSSRGTVKAYDLSASLNGVLKTFSLPAFWRIITVQSSSFPTAFRETTDWTSDASAMTITFTSQIDETTTLAAGQTITIIYAEA